MERPNIEHSKLLRRVSNIFDATCESLTCQVLAFFHWVDWLRQRATIARRKPLIINLDETSIRCAWPQVKGNVVRPPMFVTKQVRPRARATLKQMRNAITHVALVTDQPSIQALLPQIFIGNEIAFPAQVMQSAPHHPRVQFWRHRSSWNSVQHMKVILDEIVKSLSSLSDVQIIVVMDAASIHIHPEVLQHSMKLGVWLVCVPAGLTWLLQPLDTHVFAVYKAFLQNQYRSQAGQGPVTKEQWLSILIKGATQLLCGRVWKKAFEQDGLLTPRASLSKPLQQFVSGDAAIHSELNTLSEAQLALCLPRGRLRSNHTYWTFGPCGRKKFIFLKWSSKRKPRKRAQKSNGASTSSASQP